MTLKFKVGDVIFRGSIRVRHSITSIKNDRYMVDDSPLYLLFRDQDEWQVEISKAVKDFDKELEELLK
jgi:hypothetical protein